MGRKCVVPKCRTGFHSNPEKVSMFGVPKDRIEIWQKALPGKKRPLTTRDSVCAKHFKPSEIIREVKTDLYWYKLRLPKLSPDAIPSIFHFRGNYQLRYRSRESSEQPLKTFKVRRKKKLLRALLNDAKPFETVEERKFTTELHKNRQRFNEENSLTKEEYERLIQSVQDEIQKDESGENENSKRYNVIEVDGVKTLTTVDDERQLLHDDGLYSVFHDTHLKIGHYNGYNMLEELENAYQNILPRDVALFVRLCPGCHPSRFDTTPFRAESIVYNDMTAKCSVNFINYQTCPDDGHHHLMVYQNHKTKFCLLKPLKSNTAAEIAENLADIFSFIGVSTEIESTEAETLWDGVASELKRLWPGVDFEYVNALGSHIHWDIQRYLKGWMKENESCKWVKRLPVLQLEVNRTSDHSNSVEPYCALFGTTANLNAEVASSAVEAIIEEVEKVEDPEEQHFETVYSDDYFDEAPVGTACEKDPFEAIDNTYATTSNIEAYNKIPPYQIQVLMNKPTQEKSGHYIFGLLPISYQKRDKAPKEVQEEFNKRLLRNRDEHMYHKHLTKEKYDELVSRVKTHATNSKYRTMTIRNVSRLISPGNSKQRKHYVHDDELFEILHYTHINLHHAGRQKMGKSLNKKFENIISRDIFTYIELCLLCKIKNQFKDIKTPLHEHSASSDLSARCSLSFIDYERQPDGDFKYVMVYENFLTKFIMLKSLIIKEAEEVAYHLIDIFTFLGLPDIIESAEDEDFIKCVIQHLKFVWPHIQMSYHRSEESGNVETITENLKTWMERNSTVTWTKGLKFVQLMRNKDYHCEIQETPYNSLFGFADTSGETETSDNNNTTLRLMTRLYPFKNVINSSLTLTTTTEDAFKWMLEDNRRRQPNSASLSKEDYCELVSRVAHNEKNTLKDYDLVYLEGAQRLIQPSDTQEYKFYVHDDDLFLILHYIHTHTKHAFLRRMNKWLQKHFVNISNGDIVTFCDLCATCSKKRNGNRKSLKEIPMYSKISSKCCVDIIDLECFSDNDFKYVMVYQNLLTNFCILKPLKTRTPHEIASQLLDVLALIGTCLVIESREECSFVEKVVIVLKMFYSDLNVKCVQTEHNIRENIEDQVKDWLLINETTEWSRALPLIQLAWNRNIHEGMDKSPYEQIFEV